MQNTVSTHLHCRWSLVVLTGIAFGTASESVTLFPFSWSVGKLAIPQHHPYYLDS